MVDVGRTLWHYCHTLRHDGMDYGEYLDQLTYLLFLKMAKERKVRLPPGADWERLSEAPDDTLLDLYQSILRELRSAEGVVGDIYSSSSSAFSRTTSLRQIINLIDQIDWSSLPADVQAEAFEYLLDQAAAEGKKGAGQYFTPRPLVDAIVRCVQPGAMVGDRRIADPAAGTGGFLIAAHVWATHHHGHRRLSFHGTELVQRARRLALMNLLLHDVGHSNIKLGDAIYDTASGESFDLVLTNPPFGSKGGQNPDRSDFWTITTSKQINFVQHVVQSLNDSGRAAMVLPDNCFFGAHAYQLWVGLVEKCNVHTILRLPTGTFAPYTSGTRTNVIFFTKGPKTTSTWIYDARTSMRSFSRGNPLTVETLAEFIECYGADPMGNSARDESSSQSGRWNNFTVGDLASHGFKLDQLAWRARGNDVDTMPTSMLLGEILREMDAAADDIRSLIKSLDH